MAFYFRILQSYLYCLYKIIHIYSTANKKYICTRCLSYFNYERTIRNHLPCCPNKVKSGNAIDQLRQSGGYWKEQRRRRLEWLLRHSVKIKDELEEIEQSKSEKLDTLAQDVTEMPKEQNK